MRRSVDALPVGRHPAARTLWVVAVPMALVAMALVTMALGVQARWPVAIGIGLAAGLSLSGSV